MRILNFLAVLSYEQGNQEWENFKNYILFMYYKSSQIYLKYSNLYSFVPFGGLIGIFVYVLAAQTSVGQADPKLKIIQQRVWKNK